MRKRQTSHRRSFVLMAGLLLLVIAAGIACAAAVLQVQARPGLLIQGVPEKIIQMPEARLLQIKQGKQTANIAELQQSYFVRNEIPIFRSGAKEIELLPLGKMEYSPTAVQIRKSQTLSPALAEYREYIVRGPGVGVPVSTPDVVDHRPAQTPIKDQAGRGTCVCFASMAGLEAAYGGGSLDLSENYANYLYMKAEARGCKDAGLQTHMSANYLSNHGVCVEGICAYQTAFPAFCNNGGNPAPARRTTAEGRCPYKIKSFQKLWRKDDLATDTGLWINNPRYLEAILRSGKDVVFGTHVAGWSGDCTGILDVKLTAGGDPLPSVGGHAMLIVGYDRPQEYFIVKNSWGTDNGQTGYLYLSYDYIRTYAKYGYLIEEVEPLPIRAIRPMLKVIPRPAPSK